MGVGALPDFEEVGVRGNLQRIHQADRAVVGVAGVAELLAPDVDALPRPQPFFGVEHAGFQRGHGGDRLERRARRILPLDRTVVERATAALAAAAQQLVIFAFGQRFGKAIGIEARIGADSEHFAVARVERQERAAGRRFATCMGLFDPFQQGLFGLALEAEVERDLEAVAGLAALRRELGRHWVAFCVDLHALLAGLSAQVAVVVVLQSFLADDRALLDPTKGRQLELFLANLIDVAEHLRGHFAIGIGADRYRLLHNAGELALALSEHRARPVASVGLDGDRRIWHRAATADDQRLDMRGAHAQQRCPGGDTAPAAARRAAAAPRGRSAPRWSCGWPRSAGLRGRGSRPWGPLSAGRAHGWRWPARRYCSPDSTCRYHRRKKITPNMTIATPPMIATRQAS